MPRRCTQNHIDMYARFQGNDLTSAISSIERVVQGNGLDSLVLLCNQKKINKELYDSLERIKLMASKVHIALHAAGILIALQSILSHGEVVESISLGAGNTGKSFDVTTNFRLAEFKFISWKGGPESIRQNSLFKDYFYLAEAIDSRKKQLYVGDVNVVEKFLNSNRNLSSVMSKNSKLKRDYEMMYGCQGLQTVGEYYQLRKGMVELVELRLSE